MKRILIILAFMIVYVWGCCPEINKQDTTSTKVLTEIRNDTVYIDRIIPKVEITDESSTFVAMPSIETIDTVINAKETLRKYILKVIRSSKPENVIENRRIKTVLKPEYKIEVMPEKPDSIFNKIIVKKSQIVKQRPWYEIPLYIMTALFAFAAGLFLGSKLKLL